MAEMNSFGEIVLQLHMVTLAGGGDDQKGTTDELWLGHSLNMSPKIY